MRRRTEMLAFVLVVLISLSYTSISRGQFPGPGEVDLAVLKTVDNSEPSVGDTITYTIQVRNRFPFISATGVQITDVLPSGVTYSGHKSSGPEYIGSVWQVGSLHMFSPLASLEISATVDANASGVITNTAIMTLDQINIGNESLSVDIEVQGSKELVVEIDIKPGDDSESINVSGNGILPVAILGSPDFDVNDVDPLTVVFGPGEASECHEKGHIEDVNGDGEDDMILHFRKEDAFPQSGDTEAQSADAETCLMGETDDGQAIKGCDTIVTTTRTGKSKKAPGLHAAGKLTATWGKIKSGQ
ncbi:DUF11 domain-containing protein [Candidatus Poribacteria bacterium]